MVVISTTSPSLVDVRLDRAHIGAHRERAWCFGRAGSRQHDPAAKAPEGSI
jgi:hypothetical protein